MLQIIIEQSCGWPSSQIRSLDDVQMYCVWLYIAPLCRLLTIPFSHLMKYSGLNVMRSRCIQLGPVLITNHLYHCVRIIENYTPISITIPTCRFISKCYNMIVTFDLFIFFLTIIFLNIFFSHLFIYISLGKDIILCLDYLRTTKISLSSYENK